MFKIKKIVLYALVLLLLFFTLHNIITNCYKNQSLATSNSNVEGLPLPILMYHGLVDTLSLQNKYFISPRTFEEDLDFLKENGYTTIFMSDLINYVMEPLASLPDKPILLTFDDGYYNNYLFAFPLLKEKEMKATISIIGSMTEKFSQIDENNKAYSHITWEQIKEMEDSDLIEIQNHTMDMHSYDKARKGATQKNHESYEEYKDALYNDVMLLQSRVYEMTGKTPTTFAYPFGFTGKNSEVILKEMGFQSTLGCEEGINYITKDSSCLFKMKRILRPLNGSLSEIL